MYKNIASIVSPLLLLLVIALAVWGFQVREEKNTVLIKAENQYQRSFFELNDHIEQLHHELAKLQMVKAESSQRKAIANVWRLANLAQNNISQLPLSLLPFHETQKLLHNVSHFAYKTNIRDTKTAPLTQAERTLLTNLYKRTGEISTELRRVQTAVMSKQLRWMDVELAQIEENTTRDTSIVDGFQLVNEKVTEYEDLDFGPTVTTKKWTDQQPIKPGEALDPILLRKKAESITGGKVVKTLADKTLAKHGISQYLVRHANTGERITVQINQRNAEPIWFLHARKIEKSKLTQQQALKQAEKYLKRHQIRSMEFVAFDTYQQTASVTFVKSRNKTLIYPHKIVVKVALDNGEIIGLQSDLQFSSVPTERWDSLIKGVRIAKPDALRFMGKDFKVRSVQMAIVNSEEKAPILCYQFEGKFDHHVYRIFIDASNGTEIQSELLEDIEI
jgi:spore germination protein